MDAAVITGASSGIGAELARIMAERGHNLVLVARRKDRLEALAKELEKGGVKILAVPMDITSEDSEKSLIEIMKSNEMEPSVLVNNAGCGSYGEFAETAPEDIKKQIDLNISALVRFTHAFGRVMAKRKHGKIMNVSSVAGFMPGPYMSVYCATKSFVTSFSVSISKELEPHDVTVTVLCPGATVTEFHEKARVPPASIKGLRFMSARDVALCGYEAMMKGKLIEIPGIENRVMSFAIRRLPLKWARDLVGFVQKRRNG